MKKNDLYCKDDSVLRIIHIQGNRLMVIDCIKYTMPVWMESTIVADYEKCAEETYYSKVNFVLVDEAHIEAKAKAIMFERYAMVTAILPFIADERH